MTRAEFKRRLLRAKDIAATKVANGDLCLGCTLDSAGLRGGCIEEVKRNYPDYDFYITGKKASHEICPVSLRRLRRIIDASIAAL